MISIKPFVFNAFQVNTLILHDETNECIVIDAACYTQQEKQSLSRYIEENNLKPVKLVNTHCHIDHILGNNYLADRYNLKLEAHEADKFLVDEGPVHGTMFGFELDEATPISTFLADGDKITFGNSTLEVIHVPGHSPGGIALYSREDQFVITGDVLFCGSIGRTDLPGGDYDVIMESLTQKLLTLPPDTTVLPGHGPSTTIASEIATNPFINGY
jgi:hydroxyacylglutathione hydrolase